MRKEIPLDYSDPNSRHRPEIERLEAELAEWQRHGVKLDVDVEALREALRRFTSFRPGVRMDNEQVMVDAVRQVLAALDEETTWSECGWKKIAEQREAELVDLRQVTDAKFWRHEAEIHDLRARLAVWQRHGVKVTEDCERCGGHGHLHLNPAQILDYAIDNPDATSAPTAKPCPDCGGTGKKPRDGVTPHTWSAIDRKWQLYSFPAEWLEAE